MNRFFPVLILSLTFGFSAWAQTPETLPDAPPIPDIPDIFGDLESVPVQPKDDTGTKAEGETTPKTPTETPAGDPGLAKDREAEPPKGGKDLTVRSEAGRQIMLNALFANLQAAETEEDAKLVAEEIWAVFLQSRSASVDFVLMRGIAAQNQGNLKLARRMFDHVTRLSPDYAEGWSRSGRLAIDEKDFNRAANETLKALSIEPRHFYALWTLGNILETLGKPDQAYEAYAEAHKLYPLHPEINARVETLKKSAEGQAL